MVGHKPTRGRLGKGAAAAAWVLFAAVAVGASAYLHVFAPLARDVVRDVALDLVNRRIRGRIEIGHVAEVDWGRVRVEHLAVFDPAGARVLHVPEVSVELDMASLLAGRVELEAVTARDGRLRLIETAAGPPSVAEAFRPAHPRPESGETGPAVAVEDARLDGFRVSATYAPLRGLVARDVSVSGRLSVSDAGLDLSVRSARGDLVRGGEVVATLEELRGRLVGGPGGRARGQARLGIGEGAARVEARVELPEEPGEQPWLEVVAELSGVGPRDLRALGLDPARLDTDLAGTLRFDGTPETFVAAADLDTAGGRVEARVIVEEREEARVRVWTGGLDPGAVWRGLEVPRVSGAVEAHVSGLSDPSRLDVVARAEDVRVGDTLVPSAVIFGEVTPDHLRVDGFRLPYLKGEVDVQGTIGFGGDADLHVEAHVPDLAREPNLAKRLGPASGALDASLDVRVAPAEGDAPARLYARGDLSLRDVALGPLEARELRFRGELSGRADRPVLDGRVTGREVRISGRRIQRADVRVEGGPERYRVRGDVVGPQGEPGRLEARVERTEGGFAIDARAAAPESEVVVEGVVRPKGETEIETRIEALDAALLARLLGLGDLAGRIEGEARLGGSLDRPELEAVLRLRDATVPGVSFDLELTASYRGRDLRVGATASDDRGPVAVADLRAELALSLREPSRLARAVTRAPWALEVRTDARRLDELPSPIRVDVPARAALSARVEHHPGRPLVAEVDVGLTWLGETESCAVFDDPHATVKLSLGGGEAELKIEGRLGVEQVLDATVTTALDVDRWMRQGVPERLAPLDATVRVADAELSRVPWVCRVARGRVSGEVEIADLSTDRPAVLASLRGRGVRYGDAPAVDFGVEIEADGDEIDAAIAASDRGGAAFEAALRVPVSWRGAVPELAERGPLRARVAMDGFRLEPLGLLPAVEFAEGKADGVVHVIGTLEAPVLDGYVELDDVAFGLAEPAQRFEDGSGRIVFHRDWVEIDRLRLHDLGGTLRVSGGVGLDGLVPRRARLAVVTDDLPIRDEGMPVGFVTSNLAVRAQRDDAADVLEAWVDVLDLSVELPERFRGLQPLEPHPDVVIVRGGVPVDEPAGEEPPGPGPTEVVVHVDAREPFWVRRRDFAAQIVSRLDVRLAGREVRVGGFATMRRGHLDLLGKRFVLEEGRVDFAGGAEARPFVNVLLSHEPAGRPGHKAFVRVTGDLGQPELELSSTIPGVDTPAEVLGLVAGTGRGAASSASEQEAAEQAASFLAGVTAGILTLTARRELGDLFPDIAVETTGRGARFRAGFDAGAIVPAALRGVVRGAYVQGYVAAGGDDEAVGGEAVGGVVVELILPHALVLTAEVEPPTSWAVELSWEP